MYVAVIEPHPALLGPFAILLLSIAIFPLTLRQHWARLYQKLCALLATTTCGYYVFALHGAARLQYCRWRIRDFHCCGRRILCRMGIFGTMIPVLDYVEFHASDARFYWSTGLLSGVLDKAPTYLAFLTAALSLDHFDLNRLPDVAEFASGHRSRLDAISVATFCRTLTYTGNSPNLLIRAIVESRHVPAPGFLAYIIRYALPILNPILGLVGLIFFRG